VEHLLRDINDPSTSVLALQIRQKTAGLEGLAGRLAEIREYLVQVVEGRMPPNPQIAYNLQDILNLLPNLNVDELVRSMLVKTNDMYLAMYLASLVRSILALHGLLNNKIKYRHVDDVLDRSAGVDMGDAAAAGAGATKEAGSSIKEKDPSGAASEKKEEKKEDSK
jgi:26S proteasome regulatory subunit N8